MTQTGMNHLNDQQIGGQVHFSSSVPALVFQRHPCNKMGLFSEPFTFQESKILVALSFHSTQLKPLCDL